MQTVAIRTTFILSIVFSLFFALGKPLYAGESKKPNIIFILTDDQRADTIGALGNKIIHTPNLDALVKNGMVFAQAHTANPICVPSRAEILTGAVGLRNGVHPPHSNKVRPQMIFLAEVLRNAGYHTWYVGKWHTAGRPSTRGFTDTLGLFSGGGGKYWKGQRDYKGMEVTGYRGWIFQTDDRKLFPDKGVGLTPNISSKFADAAIEFIKRKPTKPFFLTVNFTAPHDPLLVPPDYEKKYNAADIPLPKNFLPKHPFDHGNYNGRDEKMLPWPRTPQAVKKNLEVYYAVISHMDEQIGRMMKALNDTGQSDNTIIIFSSDHGLAVGSHGLMGKQNMYAHTIIVPMIFSGPGIPKGKRTDAFMYLRDLYPTICDMAGAKIPKSVDAKSVLPIIQGKKKQNYEHMICYFADSQRMIRNRTWKLIYYPKIKRTQLFHQTKDPYELKDLAGDPQYVQVRAELEKRLTRWQKEVQDPVLTTK